ncbi:MAG TPA: nitroreductase family protein [Geobacteraceae bacterium]
MNALEMILSRRSVRSFKPEAVPEKLIAEVLKAAMAAPSAGNEQPWHFVVIRDRNILDAIPKFHPYSTMIHQAQVAILVCSDIHLEKYKGCGYWVLDCSAATENLLLASHALGLGAVWIGVFPDERRVANFRNLLNAPAHIIPFALVAIGYPAECLPAATRFNPMRIHYDQWGQSR